jgi:prolipoprotein diacylglyceryltransferase
MRHPAQIYETTLALMVAIITWPGGRVVKHSQTQPGFRLWVFIGLSAAARMVLETFRGDSILLLNSLREAQVIAWVVLGISLWQIGRRIHPLAVEANARAG